MSRTTYRVANATHTRSWRALAATGLVAALALAGCSSAADDDPAGTTGEDNAEQTTASETTDEANGPIEGGDLIWSIETKLSTVNPHRNGQDKATPILRNAFSSYLYRNGDGGYEPWLAESYEISEDGLTVTLDLTDGVTFSDGETFDAAAVVANFDAFTTEGYLSSIPGGLRFLEGYEATGDDTVEFTLSRPDSLFLLYLASTGSSPLSPSSLGAEQTVLEAGGPELAGIGPFVITDFVVNTELAFGKRADYSWAPESIAGEQEAAYLDTVTYRTLPEGSTRTGAIQQAQVHISSDIQPLDVATVEADENLVYQRNYVSGLPYALYFNVSKAPFDDIRVREAFSSGFDLDAIIQSIYHGAFSRAQAPISVVGPFADPSLAGLPEADIDRANELLDEAGWTERNDDGIRVKNGETLTVRAVSGAPFVRESRDQLNIAIGAALAQNVGINYVFEIEDLGTESERSAANDYEVFDNSYGGADPASGLDLLYYSSDPSRGFIARGRYNDSELEALIDAGRFSQDLEVRTEAYLNLQQLVAQNFYSLPLYQTQDNLAALTSVEGITIDEATGQPFGAYTIWLNE